MITMLDENYSGFKFMEQCMNLPLCVWGTIYYHTISSCCETECRSKL